MWANAGWALIRSVKCVLQHGEGELIEKETIEMLQHGEGELMEPETLEMQTTVQ